MKRIAVIFEGRLHEQKGVFNAVLNRVAHLRDIAPFAIDVHMIEGYDRGLAYITETAQLNTLQIKNATIS